LLSQLNKNLDGLKKYNIDMTNSTKKNVVQGFQGFQGFQGIEGFQDKKNSFYTILLFILAPLFALFMIIFVFQSYIVDGTSMTPTLQNGDRVFILKLPKSFDGMIGKTYIPSRHEIIVFKKPSDPARPKNIVFQCANNGFDIVSGKRVNGKLIAPVATMLELDFVVEDISNEIRR
jgi:signal peptidase I